MALDYKQIATNIEAGNEGVRALLPVIADESPTSREMIFAIGLEGAGITALDPDNNKDHLELIQVLGKIAIRLGFTK